MWKGGGRQEGGLMQLILLIFVFGVCGFCARGLFLGDLVREFDKNYELNGPFTWKGAKTSFRAFLNAAIVTKIVLGVFTFPSTVIYKLWTKESFIFRLSLPDEFWEKHFKEEQP